MMAQNKLTVAIIAAVILIAAAGTSVFFRRSPAGRPGSTAATQAEANGKFVLKAVDAEVDGATAQYESGNGKDNIGFWTNKSDYVYWPIMVKTDGDYGVELTYACDDGSAGSEFSVGISDAAKVTGKVDGTGAWNQFKTVSLGKVRLAAGKQKLAVKAIEMPREAVMNLKGIELTPAR